MKKDDVETRLIQCGVRLPKTRLSILDIMPGTVPVPCAAAFPYRIDRDRLLVSLRSCLQEFPLKCGRMIESPEGEWLLDGNDAGLRYTVIEADRAMPKFSYAQPMKPQMRQLTETLGYWPVNRDQPIVGIRVTRFLDGTVIGITHTHVLMDGVSSWIFLERWAQHFRGKLADSGLTFDRAPLMFTGKADFATEEAKDDQIRAQPASQLRVAELIGRALLAPLTGATRVFHLPGAALTAHKQRLTPHLPKDAWISTQDAAMGMLVQAVAAATRHEELQIGTIYDLRNLSELELSRHFVANAAMSRMFTERSVRLSSEPVTAAHTLRRLASTLSGERVRGELLRMAARVTPRSAVRYMPGFILDQFGNGLLLNNYSRFPIYAVDFGSGPPVWGDYPAPPLNRVINLLPDPNGDGVAVHLTLPRTEMRRFALPH